MFVALCQKANHQILQHDGQVELVVIHRKVKVPVLFVSLQNCLNLAELQRLKGAIANKWDERTGFARDQQRGPHGSMVLPSRLGHLWRCRGLDSSEFHHETAGEANVL